MGVGWMLQALPRAMGAVTARRLRRGPAAHGWSWRFETAVELMRRNNDYMAALGPVAARAHLERLARRWPWRGQVRRTPSTVGGIGGEWFAPVDATEDRVLLYLHGGAYQLGSAAAHADLLARLSLAALARVWAPNYRLAPEHPFPAAVDDAVASCRGLLDSGVAADHLLVGGESAGGGLALALLQVLRDEGDPLPAAALLLSPWVDLTAAGGSLVEHERYDFARMADFDRWARDYLQGADPRHPWASAVYADLRNLPPMWVEAGSLEMMLDQVSAFAERARDAGVGVDFHVWEGMIHAGHLLASAFAPCAAAVEKVGEYARTRVP